MATWWWEERAIVPDTPAQAVSVGSVLSQPVVTGPTITDAGTTHEQVTATVVSGDHPVEIVHRTGLKWQEKGSDVGSHSVTAPLSVPAEADALVVGALVQYRFHGQEAFLGVVDVPKRTLVTAAEDAGRTNAATGRGAVAKMEQAIVYPHGGFDWWPRADTRSFGWAAPELDDSGWTDLVFSSRRAGDDPDHYLNPVGAPPLPYGIGPNAWPDPLAEWLWVGTWGRYPQPVGSVYLRRPFTVDDDCTAKVFATADDGLELWIDGVKILADTKPGLYLDTRSAEVRLSAGDHVVAIRGINIAGAEPNNIANVMATAFIINGDGTLGDNLWRTEGDFYGTNTGVLVPWVGLAYPDEPPGLTPGEIIRLLLAEAQTRGAVTDMAVDFTDWADTDGNPWPTAPDIAVAVGSDGLGALKQLAATYIDFGLARGSLTLRAWNLGGRGVMDTGVVFTGPDGNLTELSHSVTSSVVNVLLVKYGQGDAARYTEVTDPDSIAEHGRSEAKLEIGYTSDVDEATEIGRALLADQAQIARTISATPEGRLADAPYDTFGVGDWVTLPGPDETPAPARVSAITVTEDVNGRVEWTPELSTVADERGQLLAAWLKRMADGALSGRALAAGPSAIGTVEVTEHANGELVPASHSGEVVAGWSTAYRLSKPARVRVLRVILEVAGTTDLVCAIEINGVTGPTATVPTGSTTVNQPVVLDLPAGTYYRLGVVAGTGGGQADITIIPEGTY